MTASVTLAHMVALIGSLSETKHVDPCMATMFHLRAIQAGGNNDNFLDKQKVLLLHFRNYAES